MLVADASGAKRVLMRTTSALDVRSGQNKKLLPASKDNSHQMLLSDNARFIASAGSYGKGRLKEYLAAQNKKLAGAPTPTSCGDDGLSTPIISDDTTKSEVLQ